MYWECLLCYWCVLLQKYCVESNFISVRLNNERNSYMHSLLPVYWFCIYMSIIAGRRLFKILLSLCNVYSFMISASFSIVHSFAGNVFVERNIVISRAWRFGCDFFVILNLGWILRAKMFINPRNYLWWTGTRSKQLRNDKSCYMHKFFLTGNMFTGFLILKWCALSAVMFNWNSFLSNDFVFLALAAIDSIMQFEMLVLSVSFR